MITEEEYNQDLEQFEIIMERLVAYEDANCNIEHCELYNQMENNNIMHISNEFMIFVMRSSLISALDEGAYVWAPSAEGQIASFLKDNFY